MGIADIDRHGIAERAQRHVEMQRVHGLGQRDLAPVEPRRPHIDADPARRRRPRHRAAPPTVSITTWSLPFSFISRSATQRVALPQASTSPPSALRMRMKASASRFFAGSIRISWSQPIPWRRSAMRRVSASSRATAWRRASMTTKSLPRPCILRKGSAVMMAGYMACVSARVHGILPVCRFLSLVIPAKRESRADEANLWPWIPAFAGMTEGIGSIRTDKALACSEPHPSAIRSPCPCASRSSMPPSSRPTGSTFPSCRAISRARA